MANSFTGINPTMAQAITERVAEMAAERVG